MNTTSNSHSSPATKEVAAAIQKAMSWDTEDFDNKTRHEVRNLIHRVHQGDSYSQETLLEHFGSELEFGTGGMRALRGIGTARINRYTISMITQGLANYLLTKWKSLSNPLSNGASHTEILTGVIAYDSRIQSPELARVTASVLAANGIRVYLFTHPRPTPELSFAVRFLKAQFGLVLTASHNPKEYSGYKVYNKQGAQIVSPEDAHITTAIEAVRSIKKVQTLDSDSLTAHPLILALSEDFDKTYFEAVFASLPPIASSLKNAKEHLKIFYTPLYGTGIAALPPCFQQAGFSQFKLIEPESTLDGNFPNLPAPNPEEDEALALGRKTLIAEKGDLLFATDPDSDRVGVLIRTTPLTDNSKNIEKLSGNQIASILTYYLLTRLQEEHKIPHKSFIANTLVTTSLMQTIAHHFQIPCYQTFTGFKHIAALIEHYAGKRTFLLGAEESFGYLIGSHVRDKDATGSALLLAEAAASEAKRGRTLYQLLHDIYEQFGFATEIVFSLTLSGRAGQERIGRILDFFRTTSPNQIGGVSVQSIRDYLHPNNPTAPAPSHSFSELYKDAPPPLSGANVLEFLLADGSRFIIRPSGTEPKIKFYLLGNQSSSSQTLTQTQKILTTNLTTLQQAVLQQLDKIP